MHHINTPQPIAHPTFTIAIEERAGRTHAKVELHRAGSHLAGTGVAYRHPADYLTSETGQELATARALCDLADQLLICNRIRYEAVR